MDYLSGDVVWCKYAGYPTWPSIVRDHEEVCEELEGMGVKRIGKPRPTEVRRAKSAYIRCVQCKNESDEPGSEIELEFFFLKKKARTHTRTHAWNDTTSSYYL